MLEFLTIIKIKKKKKKEMEESVHARARLWSEGILLLEGASSLTTVGCPCRVQPLPTDVLSCDAGEPGWSHGTVLPTALCCYRRGTRAAILSHPLSCCHQKASLTLPPGCGLGAFILVSKLPGCSRVPYCGGVNGYSEDNCNICL